MTDYQVVTRPESYPVRGEEITVDSRVAVCDACGGQIGVAELDDATLRAAYDVYRARHELLLPEHIRSIRSKYGLGQKAFARLLGWGEITLARYETGSLQSDSHDAALRLAEDPDTVRRLLEINGDRLTEQQRQTVIARLNELSADHEGVLVREDAARYGQSPEVAKLGEMMVFFAGLPRMWRTKLNKLLFYADFLHAKRHGAPISGARYIHMQYGPVPADFYSLQATLVDGASLDEVIAEEGDCAGTIFVARRPADLGSFGTEEVATLRFVAGYFEDWPATQITEYSHAEPAWRETRDRETIPLSYARSLRLD